MKNTILLLAGIVSFFSYYMLLSVIIMIIGNSMYTDIVHNGEWFTIYTLFFGWWMTAITLFDIDKKFFNSSKF